MKIPLTIIIPARKEEGVIGLTLGSLETHVKTPHTTIVVNDFADNDDRTASVVRKYAKKRPNVRVIVHPRGSARGGFARVITRGLTEVTDGAVVFVMADLCDDPGTIDKMYAKILEGWDIVSASRYIRGGGKIGGPVLQGAFSWLVNRTLHIITGIPTTDISNSYKMYRKEILDTLSVNQTSGVEASMEMIFSAYFHGARITEVPTHWTGRTIGRSKFKMAQRAGRYLAIYIWALSGSLKKKFAGLFFR